MATQEVVNIGILPNDGEGDPLRVAFGKINNNFANLFATATSTTESITVGANANQVIWQVPKTQFAHGIFQIRSGDPGTPDSQDITISAQIVNNLDGIRWTGYATTFNGNAVTTYNMDVFGSNVRILVNPLSNVVLQHFISSTISYVDVNDDALAIQLDGYVADTILITENGLILTTE